MKSESDWTLWEPKYIKIILQIIYNINTSVNVTSYKTINLTDYASIYEQDKKESEPFIVTESDLFNDLDETTAIVIFIIAATLILALVYMIAIEPQKQKINNYKS